MAKISKLSKQSQPTKLNSENNNLFSIRALLEQATCFVPFNLLSQCGYDQVIYYNANVSPDAI